MTHGVGVVTSCEAGGGDGVIDGVMEGFMVVWKGYSDAVMKAF